MKTKKTLGIASVLMVVLFCFASVSVFATQISGTEENPAQASITKKLNFGQGISIPNKTFEFEFIKENVNGKSEAISEMPDIYASVSFDGSEELTENEDLVQATAQTGNFLEGVVFPHAGIYEYTVVEKGIDDSEYGYTYSKAQYKMLVYVKNGDNGPFVYFVEVIKTIDDKGTLEGTDVKVDPTPGKNNGFIFENSYSKRGGEDMGVDASSLEITNSVSGAYADKTHDFNFTMTFLSSSKDDENLSFIRYAENSSFVGKKIDKNGNDTGEIIVFVQNEATDFSLKHGERIVFDNIPAGTKYNIISQGNEEYKSSATYVENGNPAEKISESFGANLSLKNMLIGEKDNRVDFVQNHYMEDALPTGIMIENTPFVILIVLSVAFILIYSLKRRYQ